MEHDDFDSPLRQLRKADGMIHHAGEIEARRGVGDACHKPIAGMDQGCQTLFTAPAASPPAQLPPAPHPSRASSQTPEFGQSRLGGRWPEFLPSGFTECPQQSPTPLDLSCLPVPFGLRLPLQDQAGGAPGSPKAKVQGRQALPPLPPPAPPPPPNRPG